MVQIISLLGLMLLSSASASTGRFSSPSWTETYEVTVTNIAYLQPFGGFFVGVHNEHAEKVFELATAPSDALAVLAEDGDPSDMVALLEGSRDYLSAVGLTPGSDGPLFRGESFTFTVETNSEFPYVSFASMAINTNDCFVGVNSIKLQDGMSFTTPGYDAGSEVNNELCSSIPGPACADIDTRNTSDGAGEGVVHIHRGVFGIGDIAADLYDWRNPMMLVSVVRLH